MKDSALFTGVTREMGKGGVGGATLHIFSCPPPLDLGRQPVESKDPKGVSPYISFPECPPHTHTPWPSISPTCPLEGNLSLSVPLILGSGPLGSPTLSLIHPSFPSSSPGPPPLPLALLQHNGLAACRFHDTLTPSLPVLWCSLSQTHTGPGHFHTALTPGPHGLSQP